MKPELKLIRRAIEHGMFAEASEALESMAKAGVITPDGCISAIEAPGARRVLGWHMTPSHPSKGHTGRERPPERPISRHKCTEIEFANYPKGDHQ